VQAFIKTAATIYKKIQEGVFDVSNEVSFPLHLYLCISEVEIVLLMLLFCSLMESRLDMVGYQDHQEAEMALLLKVVAVAVEV
jgi:hypothetical protein